MSSAQFEARFSSAVQHETQPGRELGRKKAMMQTVKQGTTGSLGIRYGRQMALWVVVTAVAGALSGCSGGVSAAFAGGGSTATSAKGISGSVFGGQQPVQNAVIQLYTVGTGTLKGAATPLIAPGSVTTDVNGNFNISLAYSCTGATQVYLTATGGNSGQGTNSAINLMAPLGLCTTLQANAATVYLQINEVTTVAAVYALAPFMASYTSVGAPGSNPTGLVNAVTNFNNLANVSTGLAGGANLPTGATVPAAEINTLANILAACINSSGSGSTACSTLLTATGSTETIGAALAIAQNPGLPAYTSLYTLPGATPPFQPTLAAAPNDWSIAINYTGSGTLKSPSGIAIDATGNAWVTNGSSNNLVKLSNGGTLFNSYTGGGMIGAKGLAIDRSGNVWVANAAANSLVEFNSAGALQSGTGYTGGGLNGPVSVAMDSAGNAWVANLDGTLVSEFTSGGAAVGTGFGTGTVNLPSGIALDSAGNVWVANYGNSNAVKLTHAGVVSGPAISDNALQGPSAIAIDGGSNVWLPGATTGTTVAGAVSQFNSAGVAATASPLTGGGLNLAAAVATSGTDAWVVNKKAGSGLTWLRAGQSAPLSPAAGFGTLNSPSSVAIDPSGDIWTANSGDNSVSEFIGLTAPVVTPLAANVGP